MKHFAILSFLILGSSCSSLSIDKEKITEITEIIFPGIEEVDLTPKDTTKFQCANNEFFYLKYLDENNAVWVILRDREFRLDKIEGENKAYANSTTNLDINEGNAVIKVDSSILYEECQKKTPKT
jgi:hypothetical protein